MNWKTAAKKYRKRIKRILREIDQQMRNNERLANLTADKEEFMFYRTVNSGLQIAERIIRELTGKGDE